MTNDLKHLIDRYIDAWNETDADRRRELVAGVWTDDGTYLDPLMSGAGHDSIATMIALAQQQFPEHRFELSFGPDAHNDRVRFAWTLYGPGGDAPVAAGTDFGTVAEDGRLSSVTGFLESPATA
jgi:SnoaL-like domain